MTNRTGKRWMVSWRRDLAWRISTAQPFCSLALQQGTCKPDRIKLYERLAFWQAQDAIAECEQRQRKGRLTEVAMYRFINDVWLQDAKQRSRSIGSRSPSCEQLYYNTFITVSVHRTWHRWHKLGDAGRSKTKTITCFEHNFGHGKQYLSATMLSLNLLAFLFHTVLQWSDEKYALLRHVLVRRQTFDDIRALTRYMVFESWHHVMDFMIRGLELESKLAPKLTPQLDTS